MPVMLASLFLLRPVSKHCRDWLEHHYIEPLVDGMVEAGLQHGLDFDVKPAT